VTGFFEDFGTLVRCFTDDVKSITLIANKELRPEIDNWDFDNGTTVLATELFASAHESGAKAAPLNIRIDGEYAELCAVTFPQFRIDAADEPPTHFMEEEVTFLEIALHLLQIGALSRFKVIVTSEDVIDEHD
jgi:hypothetical protein